MSERAEGLLKLMIGWPARYCFLMRSSDRQTTGVVSTSTVGLASRYVVSCARPQRVPVADAKMAPLEATRKHAKVARQFSPLPRANQGGSGLTCSSYASLLGSMANYAGRVVARSMRFFE